MQSTRHIILGAITRQVIYGGISCAVSSTVSAQTGAPTAPVELEFQTVAPEEAPHELGFGLQPQTPTGDQPPASDQAPAGGTLLGFGDVAPGDVDVLPFLPLEPVEFPPPPADLSLPDDIPDSANPDFMESMEEADNQEADDELASHSWWDFPGSVLGSSQTPGILSASNQTFSGFSNGYTPSPPGTENSSLDGFAFSASLSGVYDTNPSQGFAGANNSGGDFLMTLGGSAAYRSLGREWNYGLNYSGSYNQYFRQSDLGGYSQSAGASLNYEGGPLTASFNLGVGYGSGANRYYQSVVDEISLNYSLNANYRYSAKTILTGNFSQSLTDGGFVSSGTLSLGVSALWIYSAKTRFGPGIRYSMQSGDTQQDLSSIGPTMTVNYTLSRKLTLNSQVGLDFSEYENGETPDPSLSASIGLNYRASELWGMNLSLNSGTQASPSAIGQYEQRTSLRVGYNRKIRRATWNLGASYENSQFDAPSTVAGGANGGKDYLSFDTSLSMSIISNTTYASIFLRYSDENGGNAVTQWDSLQIGFSLSRNF